MRNNDGTSPFFKVSSMKSHANNAKQASLENNKCTLISIFYLSRENKREDAKMIYSRTGNRNQNLNKFYLRGRDELQWWWLFGNGGFN
ncbi:predicted protein [Histoplasma capsulatum var. duboisii H88]|uniref:Predicted protein n=2 Tax=Ajellomyces capsulatus TaxID=5037 RepID=F0UK19_AJEC8|nr:predicted protein [Histoplasma capsulatum H143]EGC45859.1 predicted protein [Histoplasma capsulatum var. duboisii H88]